MNIHNCTEYQHPLYLCWSITSLCDKKACSRDVRHVSGDCEEVRCQPRDLEGLFKVCSLFAFGNHGDGQEGVGRLHQVFVCI